MTRPALARPCLLLGAVLLLSACGDADPAPGEGPDSTAASDAQRSEPAVAPAEPDATLRTPAGTFGWTIPEGSDIRATEEDGRLTFADPDGISTLRVSQTDMTLALLPPSTVDVREVLAAEWLPTDSELPGQERLGLRVLVTEIARAESYGPGPHEFSHVLEFAVVSAPEGTDLAALESRPARQGEPFHRVDGPSAITLGPAPVNGSDPSVPRGEAEGNSYLVVSGVVAQAAAEEATGETGEAAVRAVAESEEVRQLLDVARSTRLLDD